MKWALRSALAFSASPGCMSGNQAELVAEAAIVGIAEQRAPAAIEVDRLVARSQSHETRLGVAHGEIKAFPGCSELLDHL